MKKSQKGRASVIKSWVLTSDTNLKKNVIMIFRMLFVVGEQGETRNTSYALIKNKFLSYF